jgi:sugar/nucleoside kinase (ribokinase family)
MIKLEVKNKIWYNGSMTKNIKKYDFIAIGGAAEDITFYTDEGLVVDNKKNILRQRLLAFEYGAKIEMDEVKSFFGGGAANVAVCLSRLGFKVAHLGAIGDDERGQRIIENFKKHKVDVSLDQIVKGANSSFSFIIVGKDKERIIFFSREAESQLSIINYQLSIIKNSKLVYITSLSGKWKYNLDSIFNANKIKIAWNPGNAQLKSGLRVLGKYLKKTDVFIVNKDEALELVLSKKEFKNKSLDWLNEEKNLLSVLKNEGPKIVVVTDGKKGAHVYDGQKFYFHRILKEKKIVDSTGVGDAFGSSFVAGLELYKGDVNKAMILGLKNARGVVGQAGAQNGLI